MEFPEPFTGRFVDGEHLFALRVYFEDTDLSGVVYHANYLRWFERARSDMLLLLGIDQRVTHEAGEGSYVIAEANLRYLGPAKLNDTVVIRSRPIALGNASAAIGQRAFVDGRLINEATIKVVFVGPDVRPRRQPEAWRKAYAAFLPPAESPA